MKSANKKRRRPVFQQHLSSQNTASAATFLRVVRCVHFVVMTKHPEATRKFIPLIMDLRYGNSSQDVPLHKDPFRWPLITVLLYESLRSHVNLLVKKGTDRPNPRKLLTEYLCSLGIDDEFTRKLFCSTNNMMRHVVFPFNSQLNESF